jgi:hypothetical protein
VLCVETDVSPPAKESEATTETPTVSDEVVEKSEAPAQPTEETIVKPETETTDDLVDKLQVINHRLDIKIHDTDQILG